MQFDEEDFDEDVEPVEKPELVLKFEKTIKADESKFFDFDELEEILAFYLGLDDIENGIILIDYALELYPENEIFSYEKANLFFEIDDNETALQFIDIALQKNPNRYDYIALKSEILQSTGKNELAEEFLDEALEVSKLNYPVLYEIALLKQNIGDYHAAIDYFTKALFEIDNLENQWYEFILWEFTSCIQFNIELQASKDLFSKLIDSEAFNYYFWLAYGDILKHHQQYEDAIEAWDYVLALNEKYFETHLRIAKANFKLKNYQKAIQSSYEYRLSKNTPEVTNLIAKSYFELEEFTLAKNYIGESLQIDKEQLNVWILLADIFKTEENHYHAIHAYNTAIELDEFSFEAWSGLSEAEYLMGNYQSAYEAFSQAVSIDSEREKFWGTWAKMMHEDEKTKSAMLLIQEGIANIPQSAILFYQFAAYAFKVGDDANAFNYLENALLLDFDLHTQLYVHNPSLSSYPEVQALINNYNSL